MQSTVFITGASSGFGEACADQYAKAGYPLILVARREDKLKALQARLEQYVPVHIATADVRRQEEISRVFECMPEAFRSIGILINNAGLALGLKPAHKVDVDDWETMIDTNIKGLLYVTHQVLAGMVERNRGHIINIGSAAGSWPYPGGNVYGATKSFVQMLSRGLRADLIGKKIRVSNIDPGLAETSFSDVRFKGDEKRHTRSMRTSNRLSLKTLQRLYSG